MARLIKISADWDSEARVWVATSEDVPGLVTEAATPEELKEKLEVLIPELLEANAHLLEGGSRPRQAQVWPFFGACVRQICRLSRQACS